MSKKLIIVSYTFPPFSGTGGRRWAKFAKYLKREGFDIRVIAAEKTGDLQSPWSKDIEELKGRIKYIPSKYPKEFGYYSSSIIHKFKYQFAKIKSKQLTSGNYYDRSIHWTRHLTKAVTELYHDGFHDVIVTVGPFHSAFALSKLKPKLPKLNLIIDFRDPWTTNQTALSLHQTSSRRQINERKMEETVINKADKVISVSKEMNVHFRNICSSKSTMFSVLPNGFDYEDFDGNVPDTARPPKKQMRFIFAGHMYSKMSHRFNSLVEALTELEKTAPDMYENLSFDFYGSVPNETLSQFDQHTNLNFRGRIPLEQVYEQIGKSDGCLLFLADDLNYALSTKFYEYMAMKKPILLFAKEGPTSKFITENSLGIHFESELKPLHNLFPLFKELNLEIQNSTFDPAEFSVKSLTQELIKIIQDQNPTKPN